MDDPKVYSMLTNTNAFQSRSDAVAAVNGIYSRLKVPSGISDSWMYYAAKHLPVNCEEPVIQFPGYRYFSYPRKQAAPDPNLSNAERRQ